MTGTEIGNYRILEKLGEGGMGVVYKAVDTSLDRVVAIKVLNGDLSRVPELVARFRSEAKAQANLNHTNLATLYAFLTVEGNSMMVMEFVDGETFAQMIHRRGPLPADGAVPMFRQALLGFGYAHRAGIIHRDIKPSNIMLNHQGIVKVMDFGIAKAVGERGLTRTGMQVGTCRYMSPEQVMNKNVDIRSDIYALGITLYEMLTANTPFQSDSEFQLMSDHVHTPPPPPTRFYPYIPKGIENAILKALSKNPDDRFQTVEQFGSALERPDDFGVAAAAAGFPAPPPLPSSPPSAYPSSPRAWSPTATMPASGSAPPALSQHGAPPPTMPPQAGPFPPPPAQYPAPPPPFPGPQQQFQPPPPGPPPRPASGGGALFGTWAGRIVLGAIALIVVAIGGWFVMKPQPPAPVHVVPTQPAPQANPSEVLHPTPNPERVDIEMSHQASAPLQVQSFEVSPNPVRPGQRATLSWSVPGAAQVVISPALGAVAAQGSRVVIASSDQQFTLVAKSSDGQTISRNVNLIVVANPTPQPPPQQQARVTPPPEPPPQQQAQPPPQQEQYRPVQPPPQQEQYRPATPPQEQYRPAQPQQPQQAAVSPAMNLYHDHGLIGANQYNWPSCWGQLQIGGGRVVFKVLGTSDGRRDDFVVSTSAVEEVKVNRMPIRGRPSFHMRINGQNFNFVPAAGAPIVFVNMINQWLQAK